MIKHSGLEDHKLKKGKFITPFNDALGDVLVPQSWVEDRLPEYLWLGLILKKYGRTIGLQKINVIFKNLVSLGLSFSLPFISNILYMPNDIQITFWRFVKQQVDPKTLEPLTLIFTFRDFPVFNREFQGGMGIKECTDALEGILDISMDNGSEFATDIRFCVVYFQIVRRKLVLMQSQVDLLVQYPYTDHSAEIMRMIRPLIRSCETAMMSAFTHEEKNENNQSALFWERISVMTECKLFTVSYDAMADNAELYLEYLTEIVSYLESVFVSTEPINKKHLVILGMTTFAYKRVKELVEHSLYNEISGRSIIRNLIELYIMLKYLLKHENEKDNIWNDYQYYGMGLYKLIVERNRSNPCTYTNGHVNYKMLEMLVQEYYDEELLDMDTRYFDNKQIRQKAEDVGEKELYGLFYDYDSSFEHGLWGAIRESSLLACSNPTHQFHNVLDCNDSQKLPSVWKDSVRVMNKILDVVNGEISIPTKLMDEVKAFE